MIFGYEEGIRDLKREAKINYSRPCYTRKATPEELKAAEEAIIKKYGQIGLPHEKKPTVYEAGLYVEDYWL